MKNSGHTPIHIAVFGSVHQDSHLKDLSKFLRLLADKGVVLEIAPKFASYLAERNVCFPSTAIIAPSPSSKVHTAVSIGGDGTFLRTVQWLGNANVPVIGINTGHLGFLASCFLTETEYIADALIAGNFKAEKRELLHVSGTEIPTDIWPYALNEVAILKDDTSSMINISAALDGFPITDYLADGLLISTPTGSTGYNLSIGGAILQPTLDAWIISPIAPHSLTMRPLVVDGKSEIKVRTTSRAEHYRVSLDGRSFTMKCGSEILIRRAEFNISLLRKPDEDFITTLRNKLHWGKR